MNTFFTSDLHFGHKNILKYQPNRAAVWGSTYNEDGTLRADWDDVIDGMNEGLIANWNAVVSANSDVYVLGDVFFCKADEAMEIMRRLNGRKHLVSGNHDFPIHKSPELKAMFASARDYRELNIKGIVSKACLFHFPIASWHGMGKGSWMLHGHSHGSYKPVGKCVDVGVDSPYVTGQYEHRPFHLDELVDYMRDKVNPVVDHHDENTNY